MTLKKISEILNSTIVPNVMGAQAEPIAEDLSNIVDFGTKVCHKTPKYDTSMTRI